MLSAFFYGLMATQLIGGLLNQLLGPRIVVGTSLGLSAIATAFVPLAAELSSFWAVFVVRLCLGAFSVSLLKNTIEYKIQRRYEINSNLSM